MRREQETAREESNQPVRGQRPTPSPPPPVTVNYSYNQDNLIIDNPTNASSDSAQTTGDKVRIVLVVEYSCFKICFVVKVSLSSSESQYMLVSVIVLVTIIVILILTIIFILYKNHQYNRGKTGPGSGHQLDSARYPLYTASDTSSYPGSLQVS